MTTFNWTVTAMDCYPQEGSETDVVFNVHWRCSGTQTEGETVYNGSVYSTCGVSLDPEAPFTPYPDLTQDQVLGWIWTSGVDKAATEAAVQQQIANQINPPVIQPPLPWAPQPTPPAA